MQRRKRRCHIRPTPILALIGFALLTAVILARCTAPDDTPKPTVTPDATNGPTVSVKPSVAPSLTPPAYVPDETEVELLARMLWGEARGIPSDMEKAACVWCVLNRVDDESGIWPDTVEGVLTQKNQFAGYSSDYPATDELKALAADVLTRWHREKTEGGDVGRVLPADYFFFTGDGKNNHFRAEYRSEELWDWSLPNPYEN